MGKASPAIVALNAGELSPQMEARIDVEQKYPLGCHIQQNYIPLKQGPAQFRPGTAFAAATKVATKRTYLRKFEFSQTQAYVLEFGDGYVRFYTNHGPLLATGVAAWSAVTAYVLGNLALSGGIIYYCILANTNQAPPNAAFWYPLTPYQGSSTTAIYEIPSPYAAADLFDALGQPTLMAEQSGDVLYIAGGAAGAGYAPRTLTRYANAPPNWQLATFAPTDGPFSDALPLVPGSEIALGVSAVQGIGVTINAYGGNVFAATDVGRLVRIASQTFNVTPWVAGVAFSAGASCVYNGNNYLALNGATTGGSPPVHTQGSALDGTAGVRWLYTDSGYGVAQITAYVSPTQVTANVVKRFPANVVSSATALTAASQANPCVATGGVAFTGAIGDPCFIYGVTGMTQLNQVAGLTASAVSGTSLTLAGLDSTTYGAYAGGGTLVMRATVEWQLGAWSQTTEWPRTCAFFKDRLFWAGKLNVWGSVPGLYTSHTPDFFGVQTTDSAMNEAVAASEAYPVNFLSSAILLLVGTQGGEYGLDAGNFSTSPLGPSNVEILRQSQWRSRPIRPEVLGTTVLYVQRAGRKLFAMDYTLWLNRYDSTDQSKYAYHITVGGIVAIALQQEPYSLLWALRADGTLLSYTFNREDNVTAWARHNVGGNGIVESIAVIPAPDGLRDELWIVVARVVNGAVVRTIEFLTKAFEGPQAGQQGDVQSSAWYVDCGVQYIAPQANLITAVTSGAAFNPPNPGQDTGTWNTTVNYTCANSFTPGQLVAIAGVTGAGTLQPNGVFQVATAGPTGFTVVVPGQFSFLYTAGGTCSTNSPTTGTTQITGIPAVLWNQLVSILADGGKQPQQVVSATGTLTLTGTFNTVTLGFPYQGNIVPMRFEGGAEVGTAQGKVKHGVNLVVRLVDAMGGVVAQLSNIDATTGLYADPLGRTWLSPPIVEAIRYNSPDTQLDIPPAIQSGDFPIEPFPHNPRSDQDARDFYVLVQQNDPYPMTVVGLFPNYNVSETSGKA